MYKKLAHLFLSVFYIGYIPIAPGTFGSIPGLLLCCYWVKFLWLLPLLFFVSYLSMRYTTVLISENSDPQWIVIDEVIGIGMACTIYFSYHKCFHWLGLILIFLFFRFFDIVKPFPIDWVERYTKKKNIPLSILIDDLIAGVFAGLATLFVMPPTVCV